MGDPYFHHHLNALSRQDGARGEGPVDLGSASRCETGADAWLDSRRAGRARHGNIPMLGEGRAVRRARSGSSLTALAAFAFVAAGIAAYAVNSVEERGPVMARGTAAARPMQDADFPVGTVFLVAPR